MPTAKSYPRVLPWRCPPHFLEDWARPRAGAGNGVANCPGWWPGLLLSTTFSLNWAASSIHCGTSKYRRFDAWMQALFEECRLDPELYTNRQRQRPFEELLPPGIIGGTACPKLTSSGTGEQAQTRSEPLLPSHPIAGRSRCCPGAAFVVSLQTHFPKCLRCNIKIKWHEWQCRSSVKPGGPP